ncbi:MAG: hypothetical protein K9K75_03580, partial [Deltaproteobacteria bacterium]|nr:hypothetical protein [Deltaproteobacteria bacterium]
MDKYCQDNGIKSVSVSTIGNIIQRYDIIKGRHTNKRYHDPSSGWATRNKLHKEDSCTTAEYSLL